MLRITFITNTSRYYTISDTVQRLHSQSNNKPQRPANEEVLLSAQALVPESSMETTDVQEGIHYRIAGVEEGVSVGATPLDVFYIIESKRASQHSHIILK